MIFKEKSKATYLQIRVRENEKEALKKVAENNGMTLTNFIKKACDFYAETLEKKK